jgi:hypothetical protein
MDATKMFFYKNKEKIMIGSSIINVAFFITSLSILIIGLNSDCDNDIITTTITSLIPENITTTITSLIPENITTTMFSEAATTIVSTISENITSYLRIS